MGAETRAIGVTRQFDNVRIQKNNRPEIAGPACAELDSVIQHLSTICNDSANSRQTPGQARGLWHFIVFGKATQ
jgi:hypothetical protein